MTSARFTRTIEDFRQSTDSGAPLPRQDYHDEVLPASSSTREIAERRERVERPDEYKPAPFRSGNVPEGGSIAGPQTSARNLESAAAPPVVDVRAQQAATIAAMKSMNASSIELQQVGSMLKTQPRSKLLDPKTWIDALTKLRNHRRGVFV